MKPKPTNEDDPGLPRLEPLWPPDGSQAARDDPTAHDRESLAPPAPSEPTSETSADGDAADVLCPQCGYDLRGIPERRCPECGYGYDRAAIRSIAFWDNLRRDSVYRRTVVLSALAVALLIARLCKLASTYGLLLIGSLPDLAQVLVVAAALFAVGALYRFYAFSQSLGPSRSLVPGAPYVLLVFAGARLLTFFPMLGAALALAVVMFAWILWASLLSRSPYSAQMAKGDDRKLLAFRSTLAMVSLVGASLLVSLCWWLT